VKAARVLAGVLFFVFSATGTRAEGGGDALFSATMTDIRGEPMPLSLFRGKPLIVNFWARACVPCRDEIPDLIALQAKYKKRGLAVLGIALEENPDKVREFLIAYKINYPIALACEQGIPMMNAFGNNESLLPFTLLIDRKGEVVSHKYGVFRKNDFQEAVEKLIR